MRRRPFCPNRVADAVCLVFAGWTLLCHATVLLGGNLDDVLIAGAVAIVLAVVLCRVRSRPGSERIDRQPKPGAPETTTAAGGSSKTRYLGVAAVAGLAIWVGALGGLPWMVVWVVSATVLAAAAVFALASERPSWHSSPALRNGLVWGLALICAAVTLCANRPDLDDALYVGMATGAADHPTEPLLARDHLHGIDSLPMLLPTYRVHTIELLAGALNRLTGVPAISWLHLVFGPLAAILAVFAMARAASHLAPRRWEWVTGVAVIILLVVGDAHAWYGNLAFVRLHQGKAVFATALVPLIIAYGIEFVQRPGRGAWLRLAAAQIAAIGTTATALWAVPVVAALTLASATRLDRNGLRTLTMGMTTAVYPAVLAAAFWIGMHHPENPVARAITGAPPVEQNVGVAPPPTQGPSPPVTFDVGRKLRKTMAFVLGDGRLPMAVLGLLLWGWWFSPEGVVRRFHLVFAAFFAVVWINPFLTPLIASSVTGGDTYWRVFWTLPLPLLGGFFLTSSMVRFRGRWVSSLTVLLTVVVLIGGRSAPVIGGPRGARLGPPSLKVPAEHEVAGALVERVPADSVVVAPTDVAAWVTTFHHHPFPVVVRRHYLKLVHDAVGGDETRLRLEATIAVTKPGRSKKIDSRLLELVDDRCVSGVVIATAGFEPDRLEAGLRARGYSAEWANGNYRIWVRPAD